MNIFARTTSACLPLSTLTRIPATSSAEYYMCGDTKGVLMISNRKPADDSQVIRQKTISEEAENDTPQADTPSDSKALKPVPTRSSMTVVASSVGVGLIL